MSRLNFKRMRQAKLHRQANGKIGVQKRKNIPRKPDAFLQTLRDICKILTGHKCVCPSAENKIGEEIVELMLDQLRQDDQITLLKGQIQEAFTRRNVPHLKDHEWYLLNFEIMMEQILTFPTWKSLQSLFGLTYAVTEVSMKTLKPSSWYLLTAKMSTTLEHFIKRRFRRYMESNEGWNGFKRWNQLEKNSKGKSKADTNTTGVAITAVCVVLGALAYLGLRKS